MDKDVDPLDHPVDVITSPIISGELAATVDIVVPCAVVRKVCLIRVWVEVIVKVNAVDIISENDKTVSLSFLVVGGVGGVFFSLMYFVDF